MRPAPTKANSQLLDKLETELGHLAARWRSTQDPQKALSIVHQYQTTLRRMIELGYRESLDVDAELPDEFMPFEYLSLHS